MSFTRHLRTKYWFPDYHSDFYNYEVETILEFQSLSTIILKILNDNISNLLSSDESTIANVENFLQKLEAFDYEDYFNSTLGSRRKKRSESEYIENYDNHFYDSSSNETQTINGNGTTEYHQVFDNIERLLNSINNIFEGIDYDDNGDDHYECCLHLDNLASALGELKDGPIYSLPKIKAADLLTESELNMMENIMHQCDVVSCGLFKRKIDVTETLVKELQEYLEIKRFNDDLQDRIDNFCSFTNVNQENRNLCKMYLYFLTLFILYYLFQI